MKYFVAIVALFMLARPVLPVAEYIINYGYISKVLCVNKEKPQMHCNGKCHLMKQLAKAAGEEKPLQGKKAHHTEIEVLFYQPLHKFAFRRTNIAPLQKNTYPAYANLYSRLHFAAVFHPPAFIS